MDSLHRQRDTRLRARPTQKKNPDTPPLLQDPLPKEITYQPPSTEGKFIHFIIFKYPRAKTKKSTPSTHAAEQDTQHHHPTNRTLRRKKSKVYAKKTTIYLSEEEAKQLVTPSSSRQGWMTEEEARRWVRPPIVLPYAMFARRNLIKKAGDEDGWVNIFDRIADD